MKTPKRADDAFLEDVRRFGRQELRARIWWLGQSGFLVAHAGEHLLLDPYLSDSLTRKYERSERPHVRISERVVDPSRLDFIDVVTSSHNHTDHLDGETLGPLLEVNPSIAVIVPRANLAFAAERLRVPSERLCGIDAGECGSWGSFEIHALPSAHEELDRDPRGCYRALGYVVRCLPQGPAIYHPGDTVRFEGMVELVRALRPDVALLPINGRDPARGVAGNLSGREAARLARDVGARLVIPCHYDMFEFNTASPEPFLAACEEIGQRAAVLEAGEGLDLDG